MTYEWDPQKAAANWKKHGVSFEDATAVFLDPLAITYPDPDHSATERREITIGHTIGQRLVFVSHCERGDRTRIINAAWQRGWKFGSMKKESVDTTEDELREEYDLSQLKGGVRGKYYRRAAAGTNVVLIEPDIAGVFPDSASVNRALRLLADTTRAAAGTKRRRKRA